MNRLDAVSFRPLGQIPAKSRPQPAQWNVNAIITTPEVTTHSQDRFTPSTRFSSSTDGPETFRYARTEAGLFQSVLNRLSNKFKPSH